MRDHMIEHQTSVLERQRVANLRTLPEVSICEQLSVSSRCAGYSSKAPL